MHAYTQHALLTNNYTRISHGPGEREVRARGISVYYSCNSYCVYSRICLTPSAYCSPSNRLSPTGVKGGRRVAWKHWACSMTHMLACVTQSECVLLPGDQSWGLISSYQTFPTLFGAILSSAVGSRVEGLSFVPSKRLLIGRLHLLMLLLWEIDAEKYYFNWAFCGTKICLNLLKTLLRFIKIGLQKIVPTNCCWPH